jgi:hypothetical protein
MPVTPAEPAPPPTPAPPAPTSFDLTLEEFCMRLSGADNRVEMVAGFHADERAKGVIKDSSENFEARYADFQVRPVT